MTEVVAFEAAKKDYGRKAIGPLTFSVESGDIVGFLGPNGSGKSTTIRMLLGLVRPTAGNVRLMGFDPLRSHIKALGGVGYSPELPNLQSFMTPYDLLRLVASEVGAKEGGSDAAITGILENVGLLEYRDYKIAKLSKGMVQRLSVAQSMVGSPRLLVLDEPMIGIDPAGATHFRSIFRDFVKGGGTIIMSSHIMSEVESLCTSLAVIHSGSLIFRGGVADFLNRSLASRKVSIDVEAAPGSLQAALARVDGVTSVTETPGGFLVELAKGSDPRGDIAKVVVESGARLLSMAYSRTELDEAYINSMRGDA